MNCYGDGRAPVCCNKILSNYVGSIMMHRCDSYQDPNEDCDVCINFHKCEGCNAWVSWCPACKYQVHLKN